MCIRIIYTFLGNNYDEHTWTPLIASSPFIFVLLSQGSKRCHDINKNGWDQLWPFYFIWLIFKKGDINDNQYGSNPKETSNNISSDKKISNSEDSLLDKKKKLNKLKLDGFITEDEYNNKIMALDTQEREYSEHRNVLNRAQEINKRAKPILDKFDSLLKDGVFTQIEYDQKWAELYDKIALKVDAELNISNNTLLDPIEQPNQTNSNNPYKVQGTPNKINNNNRNLAILSFLVFASLIAIVYVYNENAHGTITALAEAPAAEPAPEAPAAPAPAAPAERSLSIGDHYQGGIIAFLDNTGKHGLIAAPENFKGHGFNSSMSLDQAKKTCANLSISEDSNTYSNWRLPTRNELNILYQNRNLLGGFKIDIFNTVYFSLDIHQNTKDENPSADNTESVSTQDFSNGYQNSVVGSSDYCIVRPVRSF